MLTHREFDAERSHGGTPVGLIGNCRFYFTADNRRIGKSRS